MAPTFQPPAAQPPPGLGVTKTNTLDDTARTPVAGPPTAPPPAPTPLGVPARPPVADPIAGGRAGQPWAFDQLFRSYAPSVKAFAAARGATDPDGLTNEVFAEAFRSLPEFRGGEAEFKGFLFHIARRRLIDDYRRRSRRPRTTELGPRDHTQDPTDHFSESLGTDNAIRLVGELTDDQRDVIFLRVLCDLSIDQTAQALGKAPTAIKALQRRAINSLRKKIEQEGVS